MSDRTKGRPSQYGTVTLIDLYYSGFDMFRMITTLQYIKLRRSLPEQADRGVSMQRREAVNNNFSG